MSWISRALTSLAPSVRLDDGVAVAPAVRADACTSGSVSPNYGGIGYGGPGYGAPALTRHQIDELCIDQLMSRIVHKLPDDARKIDPDLSGPTLGQLDEVWDYIEARHFGDQEERVLSYSRKYGAGAMLVMVDDGRDLSEPIDLLNIRTIRGFVDLEKINCVPGPPSDQVQGAWWGPRWGRPRYYTVSSYIAAQDSLHNGIAAGQQVHPSRVIPYQHRRWMNLRQSRQFATWNGWGPGVVEAIYQPFVARTEGVMRVNGIIRSFGYDHIQHNGLHQVLEGPDGARRFTSFLDSLKSCRDYTQDGVPVIVTGPEVTSMQPLSRQVSGLADLVEVQRDMLLDYVEYPRVVLFGVTQGGLSDAASGEWQTYYQLVASYQSNVRWPGIRHAAILAMAAKDGPTGGRVDFDITAAWASMAEENEADKSKSRKENAEAREKDAAVLGIDVRTLAMYDPTVEESYPGLQAAIENGTVTLGEPTPETAEGRAVPVSEAEEAGEGVRPLLGQDLSGDGESGDAIPDSGSTPPPTPAPAIPDDLVKESDARRLLKCGTGTFARWVREGKIEPFSTGGGRRYSMAEVVKAARGDSWRWDAERMDPYPNEHAARQANPRGLVRFRRKPIAEGVTLIIAENKAGRPVTQSVRLAADTYTPGEAKVWLREHGFKSARFEEATGDGARSEKDSRMDSAAMDKAASKAEERIAEAYKAYHDTVNMSASELREWADTECSKKAGVSRDPIARNIRVLDTPRDKWTTATAKSAMRTVSFVARMKGAEQGEEVCNGWSKRDISLKNWAFDPRR